MKLVMTPLIASVTVLRIDETTPQSLNWIPRLRICSPLVFARWRVSSPVVGSVSATMLATMWIGSAFGSVKCALWVSRVQTDLQLMSGGS